MDTNKETTLIIWPLWRKIIFRFFFVYLFFQMAPWGWLYGVPGVSYLTRYYDRLMDLAVNTANANLFHVKSVLVPMNGSGDTSYGWAQLWLWLSLAAIGCLVWSLLDRKRSNYIQLNYWLCVFARYYLVFFAFIYGLIKIFTLQMPFPSIHQLATPLDDLLPMRFSWLFIGYSTPYQVFSGAMEVLAGLLLLNRRTATLGVLVATGVFINVMMLNLSYDIPVKIFSMQLVLVCLFLLANEAERLYYFFILNKPAPVSSVYDFKYKQKWLRVSRYVFKVLFIIIAVVLQLLSTVDRYKTEHTAKIKQPIKNGVYEVVTYTVNKQKIPLSLSDSLRWQDVILQDGTGSVKTADTIFRQRYRRGYFAYTADKDHLIRFKKSDTDSAAFLTLRYEMPDSNTLHLWGLLHGDSLHVELKKTNRHFQLAEKQFHWLSEHNR